jgi:cellulose synthase/poly-beta-1,6-N-acetylglucosamine synthase-like glycosyltransferase
LSRLAFWSAVALVLYAYAGYPLLAALRALLVRRRWQEGDATPSLSLIICAHNEAASIGAKLDNALALDYPRERLELLVASDGSDDGTDEIVRGYAARGVRLLALPRRGKIPAMNDAVAAARGEVLVFSDANSMYVPGALRALVRPLADPTVGAVAGDQRYRDGVHAAEAAGERAYWSFDRLLKQWQSASWSATSATGAIYVIRRALVDRVPSGVTDDFFVSTGAIARGHRLVFAPDAVAWEAAAATSDAEFRRKVRVITRGLHAVVARRALLDPLRYGFYSLQLFSHKVLRRLVVLPLIAIAASSPWLWNEGIGFRALVLAQAAVYGAAALGALAPRALAGQRWIALPHYFCMVNLAALLALWNVIRGRRIDSWRPERIDPTRARPPALAARTREGSAR